MAARVVILEIVHVMILVNAIPKEYDGVT